MQSNTKIYILLVIMTLGIFAILGLDLSDRFQAGSAAKMLPGDIPPDSFFESQNAFLTGTITKVSGEKVTVKNQKGMSKEFLVSQKAIIGLPPTPGVPGQIADLTKIKTNAESVIYFSAVNNQFEITSIQPIITISNSQPAATTSSQVPSAPLISSSSASPGR